MAFRSIVKCRHKCVCQEKTYGYFPMRVKIQEFPINN